MADDAPGAAELIGHSLQRFHEAFPRGCDARLQRIKLAAHFQQDLPNTWHHVLRSYGVEVWEVSVLPDSAISLLDCFPHGMLLPRQAAVKACRCLLQ